jgi:hypothetical protein
LGYNEREQKKTVHCETDLCRIKLTTRKDETMAMKRLRLRTQKPGIAWAVPSVRIAILAKMNLKNY